MNREQILLIQLSEECSEVIQNISKALRFGKDEVYAKIGKSNAERITNEMEDLIGVFEMLVQEGVLPPMDGRNITSKKDRVNEYYQYTKDLGIVQEEKLDEEELKKSFKQNNEDFKDSMDQK